MDSIRSTLDGNKKDFSLWKKASVNSGRSSRMLVSTDLFFSMMLLLVL